MITLSAIHVHPVKSCAPLSPPAAEVEPRGLAHDRRWMVVDADGRFVTGRAEPRLVLLGAEPRDGGLRLTAPGMPALELESCDGSARRRQVVVWRSRVDAVDAGDAAAAWLSRWLGAALRLVRMDAAARRPIDADGARAGDEVSFADGFPLLLISAASLAGLNQRLAVPVPMARFRPNLVVDGCGAHAEDQWRRLTIGAVPFEVTRPCTRCVLTTVDTVTGARDPSGEPLETLKTYRRGAAGVTFGVNLIARGTGRIALGDAVRVLE